MTPDEELELLALEEEEIKIRQRLRSTKPAAAAPAPEEPGFLSKVGSAISGAGKAATEGAEDFLTTASKYGTLGLDDELAALAARAGTVVDRQQTADDQALSGGGESVMESWRASAPAGEEAKAERRATTEAAAERSPVFSAQGALSGTGLSALGAPASALGQIAAGAAGGVGMADADTEEERLGAGAIGAGVGAIPVVGKVAAPLLRRVAGAGGPLLSKARPAATAGAEALAGGLEALATKADAASPIVRGGLALATGGSSEAGLAGAKGVSSLLRSVTKKAPTGSLVPEMGAEDVANEFGPLLKRLKAGGDEVAAPVAAAADDVVEPLTRRVQPVDAGDIIDEMPAAAPSPEPVPESLLRAKSPEVITTAGPAPKTAGGIYMPPLKGLDAKIMEAATRLGTSDLATISQAVGLPTTRVEGNLANLLRQFKNREAIRLASPTASQKLAEAAPDMPADMGSVIRKAKETARSPIDNVSGRNIKQVAAVKQQETWRATYDGLNPAQRLAFMRQIKQESGLPDDVIRQRLGITKKKWQQESLARGGAL